MGMAIYQVKYKALLGALCVPLVLLFSQGVSAQDYRWQLAQYSSSTALGICETWYSVYPPPNNHSKTGDFSVVMLSEVQARCTGSYIHPSGAVATETGIANRTGDSCPPGTTYDPTIVDGSSQCKAPEPDKCEAVAGNQFEQTTNEIIPEVCNQGCKAHLVLSIVKQTVNSKSFLSTYEHNMPGVECSAAPPPACEGDACDDPGNADPSTEKSEECSQWNYDAEGRRLQECKKFSYDKQPGVSDCKFIAGAWTCGTPKPTPSTAKNDTTTKTEVTPHPDGSTDTKTTTTTTVTKCTGVNSCSTNTTQNVNNSHTNADGSQGSSSSTCKGAGCTGGSGTGSGSGSGTGSSGTGDGEGNEEGEDDGVPGPGTSLSAPATGDFAEGIAEWDQKVATVRAELDQKMDQYSALFRGAFDLNLGQGGGRLPCYSFQVYGETAKLCLSDYEDSLINLRYVLLLVAAVVAGIIILKD